MATSSARVKQWIAVKKIKEAVERELFFKLLTKRWNLMQMLDDLRDNLEEIERKDERAYNFITSILIQKEENPEKKLTAKQFKYLVDLHNKYS